MKIRQWFRTGAPWVWLNAGAVSINIILVCGLLGLIAVRGLGHFWPSDIAEFNYRDKDGSKQTIIGEIIDSETISARRAKDAGYKVDGNAGEYVQYQIKTGNRDVTGMDFRWILKDNVSDLHYPSVLVAIERREWGNFYGYLTAVKENGRIVAAGANARQALDSHLQRAMALFDEIRSLEKHEIGAINYGLERLRLRQRRLELENRFDETAKNALAAEKNAYQEQYRVYQAQLADLYRQIRRDSLTVKEAGGLEKDIPLEKVVRVYRPNAMNVFDKTAFYFAKVWEFLSEDPREANTEGGVFPAIYGTVLMVLIMSVFVAPFGVVAAVYLREYAKQGVLTRLIRIAVNNLAGVPSIVYGVFGLGFFVYILGGNIDHLFYPESLPSPVFGTPGLLWAAVTLALLTLPVVIVSTEEGLSRIPKSIREGSLALGATKAETLWRTVLPMASPAMMTGLILAVARAAGEVAPLMLVGVVKLAPALPLDGNWPFLHLERKFMHLGFHIYDVGFQSPNVEAARPLVYATSLLLVLVIIGLNMAAITIRNHLREKYRALEN
ncbi:MAG: phosphate ABC transporter permease PstA [Gammaproteobacteria bacterium]